MTYGERAVGLSFNPSADPRVDECKRKFAEIIDALDELSRNHADPEVKRMCSIAITDCQSAQMWAVKAVTWRT